MDNFVTIDLEHPCKVINNLIDKFTSGIGWIATHETPDRLALKTYIEDIQKSDVTPLVKAAMISNANKTIKEYSNQYNIVKIAIENMADTAKPENIDNDWLSQFMDKARLISDEQFQLIWGHILKEECNVPNSIPKALLNILSQMDKKDAEVFSILCSLSVYIYENGIKMYAPIIIASHFDDYYSKIGIEYNMLSDLQSLGLIEIGLDISDDIYMIDNIKKPINIHYFDESYKLPDSMDYFLCGNVIYTKSGSALCRALNVEKRKGFFDKYCVPMFEKQIKNQVKKN